MKLRALVIALFAVSSTAAMANISSSLSDTSNVRELQQALNDKGFDAGAVDGKAGPQTKAAIKKFQQAQNLTASGKLDQKTVAALALNTSTTPSTSSASPSSNDPSVTPPSSQSPNASQEMKDQAGSSSTPQQPSNPTSGATPPANPK
jgi:peptidoglycan hydrolase-like protein with peptidoglycan-binding domain